jgi:hypothetical protein
MPVSKRKRIERMLALFAALDPVRLLQQLHTLQEALWRHAVVPSASVLVSPGAAPEDTHEVRFNVHGCGVPLVAHPAPTDTAASVICSPIGRRPGNVLDGVGVHEQEIPAHQSARRQNLADAPRSICLHLG